MTARRRIFRTLLVFVLAQGPSSPLSFCAETAPLKRILVLVFYEASRPGTNYILQGLEDGLRTSFRGNAQITVEFLGSAPPEPADFPVKLADWMVYKYGQQKFDAIVAIELDSFRFAKSLRDRLWPGVPILLVMGAEEYRDNPQPAPHTTRLVTALTAKETIRSALQLLPGTRRIALIGGAAEFDQQWNKGTVKSIRELNPDLEIIDLTGLSLEETKARASSLPDRTIVYIGSFYFDVNGRKITIPPLVEELSTTANAPLFNSFSDLAMGKGIVGGVVESLHDVFFACGEPLARILKGADADSLPTKEAKSSFIVDWRQLKRWGISERTLPPNATILYREVSVWEQYRRYILSFLSVLAFLLSLIVFLLLERQRRRKEEQLTSAMLESIPGLALLVTKSGNILRANHKNDQTTDGMHLQMVQGQSRLRYDAYLRKLVGATADSNQALPIQEVTVGKRATATVELPLPDEQKWIEIRATQLQGPKGGSLVVHLDTTQRKLAELEQNKFRDEIYHLNRVAALGQLAGSLAHELSQPLAAILSNAQAAQRFADRSNPDMKEVREALEDITRDDKRARSIIQEMRSMLKKESITRQAVDLNAIVRSLSQILKNEAIQSGVRVQLELVPGELLVLGDWVPLQQVLLNLMKNGMDAMREIAAEQRFLTVKTESDSRKKTAAFSVEDNGPGVAQEIKTRLFEPFITTKKDGLGMGLSICYSIIKSMGGQISLRKSSVSGANFRVELPLVMD